MPEVDGREMTVAPVEREEDDGIRLLPALDRFVSAVDAEVDARLTDDVIEARLASVRREAVARAKARPAEQRGFVEELAAFGYATVHMWLRLVRVGVQGAAVVAGSQVDLQDNEIDELAKDTVARAIISYREAANSAGELRAAFLSHCLRMLPEAYASRQLRLGRIGNNLDVEGHQAAALQVVEVLRHLVHQRREETAMLLNTWAESGHECAEVLDLTRQALQWAGTRAAEGGWQ